jgi:cholesterol transport system auxiliary component
MKIKVYILIIFVYMGVVSCTKAPAYKIYTLDAPKINSVFTKRYRYKNIKVAYPQSIKEEISERMNFSYSNSDRGVYQNSEWSNSLGKLLQGTLIEVLESTHYFKAVLSDDSIAKENLRLESNIYSFEHRVRGRESYAIISIQFMLINADTGNLIKSRRFSYREATKSTDAKGYAKATNVALAKLSRDLVRWLR